MARKGSADDYQRLLNSIRERFRVEGHRVRSNVMLCTSERRTSIPLEVSVNEGFVVACLVKSSSLIVPNDRRYQEQWLDVQSAYEDAKKAAHVVLLHPGSEDIGVYGLAEEQDLGTLRDYLSSLRATSSKY
ncbi:hypothetical protein HYZ97_00905 [Candidatus Pacearchaeota archaeon]|nr:hypothetical protein [Candidatus Pacearchaeota archaeon]